MSNTQTAAEERIPVTVLTGFLGSGKTTLLNKLLRRPELADTAVIINEFGEIGLDHLLVEKSNEDGMVTLNSGCLCCTVRGDLVRTMSELFLKRSKGEVTPFKRMVVETTGLAEIMDGNNVGMTQAGQRPCFLLETRRELGVADAAVRFAR